MAKAVLSKNTRRSLPAAAPKPRAAVTRSVISLGYIPLVDCAPLVAALEWGHFRAEGLNVRLVREIGWSSIRERLIYHELDAAQALAPMAFSIKLGLGCAPTSVLTSFVLNLQGNAITLSAALRKKGVRDALTLARLVRSERPRRLTFGVVSLYSMHHLLLRKWLASGGIDSSRDIRLVVLPPSQMSRSLASGSLDGYCVGEPWNSLAVQQGAGWCPAVSSEISPLHPEKVLLLRSDFAAAREYEHLALIRALDAACAQCETPEGRQELTTLLAYRSYLNVPSSLLTPSLLGPFACGNAHSVSADKFHLFHRSQANVPSVETAQRLFLDIKSAGMIPSDFDNPSSLLHSLFREDIYRKSLTSKIIQLQRSNS